MIKLETPEFKDEAEEAQWWFEHADDNVMHFEKALADGTLTHGTTARRMGIPTTTIRLDPEDISLARVQAEKRGLKYQTYLKMLIHEALVKAEQSSTVA
jgi:predicted DNA binding CopG/RHH family protein